LEWPVVIPINMTGRPHTETAVMQDRRLNVFSTPVLDVEPAGYAALKQASDAENVRERVRLWYVATTRARDLLILPRHTAELSEKSWAKIVDLQLDKLPRLDQAELVRASHPALWIDLSEWQQQTKKSRTRSNGKWADARDICEGSGAGHTNHEQGRVENAERHGAGTRAALHARSII
jgi:ATP-dependent exoDNAse (exonuclease V) beta subunit